MMNLRKNFFIGGALVAALAMVGCTNDSTGKQPVAKEYKAEKLNLEQKVITKGKPGKNEVTLTFAATADMHGRIYPYEYAVDEANNNTGFAKANSIVQKLRVENPNMILMDVGDTVQDNSAELFNHMETHPIVQAMNAMNYDLWVLGNHEFNFEQEFIRRNIKNFKGSVVTSNIYNEEDGSHFVLPYQLFNVEGVRVAVVGMIPPHVPMWEASAPEHFKGLTFEDPAIATKKTLDELKGKYDVLIGAVHLGRKDEYGATGAFDIANKFPEFDIIFGGHEHARYVEDVNGVKVLEPGAYGWGVAVGNVKLKQENGKWTVKEVTAKNVETKDYEADPKLLEQFKDIHEKSIADANQVVGKVTHKFIDMVDFITGADKVTTMPTSQLQDNSIIQLINDVQLHYTGADVSAAAIFTNDSNLQAGDFKKKDVAFIYKYTNTLMGINMTGENLLKFMEWSAGYYNTTKPGDVTVSFNEKVRGYNYDMFDGITYDIDLTKDAGSRIVNAKIKGKPVDPNKKYKVAVNNYRFGTLTNLKLATEADKYYDSYELLQDNGRIREMIVAYVQKNLKGKLSPKVDNNWKLIGMDPKTFNRPDVVEKIKTGEIQIPKSEDGRTPNVKSVNIKDVK